MADELNQGTPVPDASGVAGTRPEGLADSYWDATANAPKFTDITKDLGELTGLREFKTAADTRAAAVPATADDYKLELPEGFKIPEGLKFAPDAKDPLVVGSRTLAKELGLDQPAYSKMVGFYGQTILNAQQAEQAASVALEVEQTKALGEKASERREAAKTWMTANLSKDQATVLESMLTYKVGVEAIEAIVAQVNGAKLRGGPQNGANGVVVDPAHERLKKMFPTMAGQAA